MKISFIFLQTPPWAVMFNIGLQPGLVIISGQTKENIHAL